MTQRERILAVYRGETPDTVPFMLDLSHWFYHKNRLPWDISVAYEEPEYELIDYHRKKGVGFYLPNLGSFFRAEYGPDVKVETMKHPSGDRITWRFTTPSGSIERTRFWEEVSYSWAIADWGVKTEQDMRVLGEAMGGRKFALRPDRYEAWVKEVGDLGVVYLNMGYSAMGYLLNYWMGTEETAFAAMDYPEAMHAVVDQINESNLRLVDEFAKSPTEVILMGDNLSSDVQPPHFFREWSHPYYAEAIRRFHAAGKKVALHIDGRLRGAIQMVRDTGADCGDAITPQPLMNDLSAQECRDEAGKQFILSGGVPPGLWLPNVDVADFKKAVMDWLELRKQSPALIANAGDQVPPNAVEDRIEIMRDMVEKYGRY